MLKFVFIIFLFFLQVSKVVASSGPTHLGPLHRVGVSEPDCKHLCSFSCRWRSGQPKVQASTALGAWALGTAHRAF